MEIFNFIVEGKGHPDKIENLDDAIKSMTWRFHPPVEATMTVKDLGDNKYHVCIESEAGIRFIYLGECSDKASFRKLETAVKEAIQPSYPDIPLETLIEICKKQIYYSPKYKYRIQKFTPATEFFVDILYPDGDQYCMSDGINIKDNLRKAD